MAKRAEFTPNMIRVRLNPEQAVLTCEAYHKTYTAGYWYEGKGGYLNWHEGWVFPCSGTKETSPQPSS
jgi:hypothetical protein